MIYHPSKSVTNPIRKPQKKTYNYVTHSKPIKNLVGGLEHEFHFSMYWECQHIPTDIFQRVETTNQKQYPLVNTQFATEDGDL